MVTTAMTSQQTVALLELAHRKGVTPERMTEILSSGLLADLFDPAAILIDRTSIRVALALEFNLEDVFTLTIDYDAVCALEGNDRIRGTGLRWINRDVGNPYCVSITGTGLKRFEARIFSFDTTKHTTREVIEQIGAMDSAHPWEPARLEHLLALAKPYPGKAAEKVSGVAALGSVAHLEENGKKAYPKITTIGGEVGISRIEWDDWNDWKYTRKFLAVRPLKD